MRSSFVTLAENLHQALMYEADEAGADPDDTPESARAAGKEKTDTIPLGGKGVPSGLPAAQESLSQILAQSERYLARS